MRMITKTRITEEPQLVINYDSDTESPREWSNLGYFITKDRSCLSPDSNKTLENIISDAGDQAEDQADHMKMIKEMVEEEMDEKVLAIYPVVKYEHSGITYSLGTAHGFDYSNNGFYIVTDKSQKETGSDKKDWKKVIEQEIANYNQYVNGEIYYYILYDKTGEHWDSCGGYYSLEDIRDHLPKEWKNEELEQYLTD